MRRRLVIACETIWPVYIVNKQLVNTVLRGDFFPAVIIPSYFPADVRRPRKIALTKSEILPRNSPCRVNHQWTWQNDRSDQLVVTSGWQCTWYDLPLVYGFLCRVKNKRAGRFKGRATNFCTTRFKRRIIILKFEASSFCRKKLALHN